LEYFCWHNLDYLKLGVLLIRLLEHTICMSVASFLPTKHAKTCESLQNTETALQHRFLIAISMQEMQ